MAARGSFHHSPRRSRLASTSGSMEHSNDPNDPGPASTAAPLAGSMRTAAVTPCMGQSCQSAAPPLPLSGGRCFKTKTGERVSAEWRRCPLAGDAVLEMSSDIVLCGAGAAGPEVLEHLRTTKAAGSVFCAAGHTEGIPTLELARPRTGGWGGGGGPVQGICAGQGRKFCPVV